MPESPQSAPEQLEGLVLEACEWLPSGANSGLVRVRGRWTAAPRAEGLPALWLRSAGERRRFDSLPDTRFPRGPEVWRGTYVVPAELIEAGPAEQWLEWEGGPRVALPSPAATPDAPTPATSAAATPTSASSDAATSAVEESPGGEVIDRAVLADRRARRAEAAAREQARVAAEALRAVEVLERRLEDAPATSLREELEAERRERKAQAAAFDAEREQAALALATARQSATDATHALQRGRFEADAARAAVVERERALSEARAELETARSQLRDAETAREAEAVARGALDEQLDRERATNSELRAELEAERARRADLEARLEAERGSLTARIATLDRQAAGLAGELELQRRAREQAEAADRVTRPEPDRVQRVAADLDAAAAALRQRMAPPAEPATPTAATPTAATPAAATPEAATPEPVTPDTGTPAAATPAPATPAAATPGLATPERVTPGAATSDAAAPQPVTSAAATPDAATPESATPAEPATPEPATPNALPAIAPTRDPARHEHRLRTALVRLAREDPSAAGRILAGLLPAQAAILRRATDYDLTIREAGTYAITVAGGRGWVKRLDKPRGRRGAEFHLSGDALSLASLLAGADIRPKRFSGPVRVKGRRRRAAPVVKSVVASRLSLAEAVRAGADLAPELVIPAIGHAIDPAWTRGHTFTIEYRVADGATFVLIARDAGGLSVTRSAPENPPDATVATTVAGFQHLLRDEPAPPGERPSVRGDGMAVALLKAWLDRAR